MKDKILQLKLSLSDTEAEIFLQNGFFTRGEIRTGDMHCHQFCELHYIASGSFSVYFKESTMLLRPGNLLMLPPRIYHRFEGRSEKLKRLSFQLRLSKKRTAKANGETAYEKLFFIERPLLLNGKISELESIASLMGQKESEEMMLSLQAYFTLAFFRLCRLLREERRESESVSYSSEATVLLSNDAAIIKALRYIAENHTRRLLLAEVARFASLSPRHLERILKRNMSESFRDILTRHWISTATQLLREENDCSLEEIAALSGFGSYVSFYHAFVSIAGVSPSEFRKSKRGAD